jgi:hypothetical protein
MRRFENIEGFDIINMKKQGTVSIDYLTLEMLFGKPKTNCEWSIKFDNDVISTIIPVGSGSLMNIKEWNICGVSFSSMDEITTILKQAN